MSAAADLQGIGSASGAGGPQGCAGRHAHEVRFWAARLDELVIHLPGLRRHRGNEGASRLVAEVLAELARAQGEDRARQARERLIDRWRDRREAVRVGT